MKNWHTKLVAALAGLTLAACQGVETSSDSGTVTASSTTRAASNSAPTITGVPGTAVIAGTAYLTQIIASDSDGDTLTYSATGLPAWATLNPQTGQLSGMPSASDLGTTGDIVVRVSDGRVTAALPAFRITVVAPGTALPAPVQSTAGIFGSPQLIVNSGGIYSFTPTVNNPGGNPLTFSITGKPVWASFNAATGALTGTAMVGTWPNIVISVSDGTVTYSLPAFTVSVNANINGTATLSWSAPAQNTDGTALTDLAGYRIYHGTNASALSEVILLPGASNTSYQFTQLPSGTHYFAVAAYSSLGVESALSAVGSKTIL